MRKLRDNGNTRPRLTSMSDRLRAAVGGGSDSRAFAIRTSSSDTVATVLGSVSGSTSPISAPGGRIERTSREWRDRKRWLSEENRREKVVGIRRKELKSLMSLR